MMGLQIPQWDAEFWGRKIALMDLSQPLPEAAQLEQFCGSQQVAMVQACVDAQHEALVPKLEALGFEFVDLRLEVFCRLADAPIPIGRHPAMMRSTEADIPGLLAVCNHSFSEVSRYNWNGFFPPEKIDAFYNTWLENGVRGVFDDFCMHYREDSKIMGFTTIRVRDGDVSIGIIAVGSEYRGKGIGDILVSNAFAYASEHGLASVSSVTQGRNAPTQKLYAKHGLQVQATKKWYYKKVGSL